MHCSLREFDLSISEFAYQVTQSTFLVVLVIHSFQAILKSRVASENFIDERVLCVQDTSFCSMLILVCHLNLCEPHELRSLEKLLVASRVEVATGLLEIQI